MSNSSEAHRFCTWPPQPHLGTDRLIGILRAFRTRLLALGVRIRWGTAISSVDVRAGTAVGVHLAGERTCPSTQGSPPCNPPSNCGSPMACLPCFARAQQGCCAWTLCGRVQPGRACTLQAATALLRFPPVVPPAAAGGEYQRAAAVVLATGHSSRSLFEELLAAGVAVAPKPFAMGFRIEHPQQLINELQWVVSVPLTDMKRRASGNVSCRSCVC